MATDVPSQVFTCETHSADRATSKIIGDHRVKEREHLSRGFKVDIVAKRSYNRPFPQERRSTPSRPYNADASICRNTETMVDQLFNPREWLIMPCSSSSSCSRHRRHPLSSSSPSLTSSQRPPRRRSWISCPSSSPSSPSFRGGPVQSHRR